MRRKILPIATPLGAREKEGWEQIQRRKRIQGRLFVLRSWLKTGKKWGDWYRQEKGTPLSEEEKRRILQEIQQLEEERAQLNTTQPHAPA